ncbi:MAG: trigger factor family protein [Bacteroidales bacterium]|nr:trigger factor family protein [Bacteroidales bacterium]
MNLSKRQIDDLNLELTLEIAPEDYEEAVRKRLAERRRTAEFKGFRKGMVPPSLIKRVYGEQALAEAVNEVISTSLDNYITENKLHLLGEPLGSESQPEIEWAEGNTFTFIFDAALAPEVNVAVEASDVINKYSISATAKEKAEMAENLKKFYAELKEGEPKTDEEIEKEVNDRVKEHHRQESDWRLSKDIRDFYVAKAGLKLPEEFLKRWLLSANDGKVSKEDVEKEFPAFAEDFKWQMVRGKFMKDFGFEITHEDLVEAAKAYVSYQYAMYGLPQVPDDMLMDAVGNIMKDRRQLEHLSEQVEDRKVLEKIKETVTFKDKKISSEKFREL